MHASQTIEPSKLAQPLHGSRLVAVAAIVWLAGAAYCHGYERILTGRDPWASSLIWSALAVMPWFALFEWSKSERGRRVASDPRLLLLALIGTAAVSLLLELGWQWMVDGYPTPLALALMRRLPAIGASVMLILWALASNRRRLDDLETEAATDTNLLEIADAIDWIAAADNYVELHIGERTLLRRMTLRAAEKQLADRRFVRIHRRFLINRRKVERIIGSNGDRRVVVAGAELPIGSRFAGAVEI